MMHVRGVLGEETFALAYSAGMRLSLDEAVGLAHSQPEPSVAGAPAGLPPRPRASSKLTDREVDVAILLARGLSKPQIATELVISTSTAQQHVENILGKLGLNSRTQVAVGAVSNGLAAAPLAYGIAGGLLSGQLSSGQPAETADPI